MWADAPPASETLADVSKKSGLPAALQPGDVLEVDGFKRLNAAKYPGGPQCAFQLVQMHVFPAH